MQKKSHWMIDLDKVDLFSSNVSSSRQEALLYVLEVRSSDQDDHKGKKPDNETCSQNPQSCFWLVVWSNQFGLQDPNQIHWHLITTRRHANKGKFHTWLMESFLSLFNISHFSSTNCLEVMSKRTQEDAGEESHSKIEADDEFSLAMQQGMGKTRYESQILLSSWNEQQSRTVRLVMGASSSNYLEWNTHEKCLQELLEARTGRLVSEQPAGLCNPAYRQVCHWWRWFGLWHRHRIRLVVKIQIFLHRVNDRLRKILDQSSKDAIQDCNKHSYFGESLSST